MIPVNLPSITESDIEAVVQTLRAGWISGEAPIVAEFEEKFARIHGQRHGVAVANGSLALDLVISTLGIGPGDEIILPAFTIISCMSEILRRGATPRFVDADPVTWNMDVSQVEELISSRTRAIMAVHVYGLPVDMDPLLDLAKEHGIPVIEDSAEAHGLMYKDRVCGSLGFASTFSFYANKNVTTGEGGMILTSGEIFAERLRYFRNLTFRSEQRFVHEELGWNMRITAVQAALGISQLSRLEQSILRRREIAALYRERLLGIEGVSMAPASTATAINDYWVVGITLDTAVYSSAHSVAKRLNEAGVQTRPFFFPLHRQPVYKKSRQFKNATLPVSEYLGDYGLYLPNGLGMKDEQLEKSIDISTTVLSQ